MSFYDSKREGPSPILIEHRLLHSTLIEIVLSDSVSHSTRHIKSEKAFLQLERYLLKAIRIRRQEYSFERQENIIVGIFTTAISSIEESTDSMPKMTLRKGMEYPHPYSENLAATNPRECNSSRNGEASDSSMILNESSFDGSRCSLQITKNRFVADKRNGHEDEWNISSTKDEKQENGVDLGRKVRFNQLVKVIVPSANNWMTLGEYYKIPGSKPFSQRHAKKIEKLRQFTDPDFAPKRPTSLSNIFTLETVYNF